MTPRIVALHQSLVLNYDVLEYPFQQILSEEVFRVPNLGALHRVWKKQTGKVKLSYTDNLVLRKLMQQIPDDSVFYQVYHRWVAEVVAPHFGHRIRYAAHPKMRVHLAGTRSVSDFHRDAEVTGRPEQINCYLPFTDVFGSNTLWCENDYGEGNYRPLELRYGQALLWDGGMLEHGTYANQTDHTRVSCDFRFHPKAPELVSPPWNSILNSRPKAKEDEASTAHRITTNLGKTGNNPNDKKRRAGHL
ncbi:streptomycin biosynthesis enzyme StrG [bacterium SCSIO 12741]|nr:streptomycin biosynthesis enzyme StrG [bacterium SCSIO 12741]